ncbi:MAG: hypothetical protein O2931_12150 [Planctomycetota bacterium]|nr:hypothetical protein [Planctomycetota bacterium]MDA1179539.1 hypothetical protein [Planctomycetota bacterium]
MALVPSPSGQHLSVPAGTQVIYPNGVSVTRSDSFDLSLVTSATEEDGRFVIPAGTTEPVKGSSWGTFTIFCTIPIALFVSFYMYRLRPGHTFEASVVGAVGVLFATYAGSFVPDSPLEPYFSWGRQETILAMCGYGFIASVLPVWMLLCPRDYISSFLKIGTIAVLVIGIMLANPRLEAPAINTFFSKGGGPLFQGGIFPFVFICVMCGSISGFHSLVASGTTPKMIGQESHIRVIGYGAMLLEGLVGVVALLVAAALPQGDFWAINIDISKVQDYAGTLVAMGADVDHLPVIEQQVGGESLRGRTGGAVTLAVGMAQMMTTAMQRLTGANAIEGFVKYWYHFAIMFEALFILTTIDTGTRIARFLLQELLGKVYPPFEKVDWTPGVWISTGLVTLGWGGLIWTGSIETIWPMFGVANQFLAMIALIVVTTYLVQCGRRKYIWVTLIPLAFISVTTTTAAVQLMQGRFWGILQKGWRESDWPRILQGTLNIGGTLFILICVACIAATAIAKYAGGSRDSR